MDKQVVEKMEQLELVLDEMNKQGMPGMAGAAWPVIIRQYTYGHSPGYVYEYPNAYFLNLQIQKSIYLPYEKKADRIFIIKRIIDKHINGEIDIFLYHFGMFCVYGSSRSLSDEEDFTESSIGKKRSQFVQSLPRANYMSTDDFVSAVWSYQIERRKTDIGDYQRNPTMSRVRILFTPDQFDAWTGRQYSNAEWVEPISSMMDLACRKWSGEHDPMAPVKIPEDWVEGPIVLGHEGAGNGLRHFVQGLPVRAGEAIQVKFGGGWIQGRYEWSFEKSNPIRVHSGDDVILIRDGHTVRIKK